MIDKIVFFLKVVRYQSFSKAAREHRISSGAASRWIYELEQELGVTLLKRSTRRVILSEAGKVLYERFQPLHGEIEDIISNVREFTHTYRGHMKIASTPMFANCFLKEILGKFMKNNLSIQVTLSLTALEVDMAEYDFAIRAEAYQDGMREQDVVLVKKRLWRDKLCVCATPDYIAAFGAPADPEDLKVHRCLYSPSLVKGGNFWVFNKEGKIVSIKLPRTLECDSAELLVKFVLDGVGIAYLPEILVREAIAQGKLTPLLTSYTSAFFDFYLYWQPNRHQSQRNSEFRKMLVEAMQDYDAAFRG